MRIDGLNNIVVVGAGSAGWMTALYIQKIFPTCNITVIGSKELGILGAGEGTVPNIKDFLIVVDIHPYELLLRCRSTPKIGIKFVNWKNDNSYYYHAFGTPSDAFAKKESSVFSDLELNKLYIDAQCYINDLNPYDFNITDQHIERLIVPLTKEDVTIANLMKINNNTGIAWHFDAIEIAKYFEEIGVSRGIRYIDDYVTSFNQDEDEYVTGVNTLNGSIECDFIFDCSGFKRLIIDKLYKSEWINLTDRLTVNRALPFFLPPDKQLKNYTTATAMKSGWVWEIPLQHRSGCGYVFNSNFCDDETAKKELQSKYGDQIEIPKSFSFNAGYFKQTWIKNCIAIGLSTGFVEPMEATSIFGSTYGLSLLKNFAHLFPKLPKSVIEQYNTNVTNFNETVSAFIQFHYMNKRKDTKFWLDINNKQFSNEFQQHIRVWENKLVSNIDRNYLDHFNPVSWTRVGFGVGFFDKQMVKKQIKLFQEYYHEFTEANIAVYLEMMNSQLKKNVTHQEFLEMVVGKEQLEENRKLIFK